MTEAEVLADYERSLLALREEAPFSAVFDRLRSEVASFLLGHALSQQYQAWQRQTVSHNKLKGVMPPDKQFTRRLYAEQVEELLVLLRAFQAP